MNTRGAILLSVAVATMAMAQEQVLPRFEILHRNDLGPSYYLKSVTYVLDGSPLFYKADADGSLNDRANLSLYKGTLSPGLHAFEVTLDYVGRSSVFQYVNSYRVTMKGRMSLNARAGHETQIKTIAELRDDVTLEWRDRPRFRVQGRERPMTPTAPPAVAAEMPADGGEPSLKLAPVQKLGEGGDEDDEQIKERLKEDWPACDKRQKCPLGATCIEGRCRPLPRTSAAVPSIDECAVRRIFFESGAVAPTGASFELVDQLARCLQKNPQLRVRLEGHSDLRGSEAYNLQLAILRVDATARALASRGVTVDRIEAQTVGKRAPLCVGDSESCQAKNRRVEFILLASPELARPF